MTENLYYKDVNAREFEAEIVEVGPDGLTLAFDRSAFFPGGGGQPCDLGTLTIDGEPYQVTEVYATNGIFWHKLDRAVPVEFKGREVKATIDWERRFAHMRHHSALHILNGVAFNAFGSLVTGGQVYTDRARIDLTLDDLSADRIEYLERESNAAIEKGIEILPHFLSREEAAQIPELVRTLNAMPPQSEKMRIIEIVGLDRQFCGGTHLSSTREMGKLKVLSTRSKGKNNKRIEIGLE